MSPIPSSSSLNRPSIVLETNAIVKPIRMKQRSGQRAFSESEAQAYSHIINTIGKVKALKCCASNRLSYIFSCQYNHNILCTTLIKYNFLNFSYVVPGASVTSMSSTGSYTDNPGYHTLRTIHNRY